MLGQICYRLDHRLSRWQVRRLGERGGLIVLSVHHLFASTSEADKAPMDPQQRLTVDDFRQVLGYYLKHGYTFVSPEDIPSGLVPGRRQALLTFDDGYFNNVRALPVLEEFKVPALFFIAAGHVAENRPFWNDVLHREGRQQGRSAAELSALGERFKQWSWDRVDQELVRLFGARTREVVGDLDRPMTPAELRDFSRNQWVRLGNHTVHHVGMPFFDAATQRAELDQAQAMLREWTGRAPDAFAYPFGLWNQSVVENVQASGLRLAFTAVPEKVGVPVRAEAKSLLVLGRFLPNPGPGLEEDLEFFRSDLMLRHRIHRVAGRVRGRAPGGY